MSRIERVRTRRLRVPLHTPFVTALRRTTTIETVLLELTDSDGATGWGEAPAVWRVTGESLAGAEACLDGPLAEVVVGLEPQQALAVVQGAVVGNHGATSAVDVALHDLLARRDGLTLAAHLGGGAAQTSPVATDVTLAAGRPHEMAAAAVARVAEGFDVLKLKVGADPASDVSAVRAVREAVGPAVRLRLDANQAWDAHAAVATIRALEDAGVDLELVEQPVPARDLLGLAHVTAHVATPVMADESLFDLHDLVDVIRLRAADSVNVKLAKCGGLTPALELLAVAASHGLGTMVGTMMESHVGVGAAASLVAAVGTSHVSDLDAAWWAGASPYVGGMSYDGPAVALPAAPGLGIEGVRT